MANWSAKWKKALIWLCGYLHIAAFALVGGYVIVKSDDDELKAETKRAFVVTLIVTAVAAVLLIMRSFGGFSDNYYGSGFADFVDACERILAIAKPIVFAVFLLLALFGKPADGKSAPARREKSAPAAAGTDDATTDAPADSAAGEPDADA